MKRKLLEIFSVDFETTGQLLIMYSRIRHNLQKKWEYNEEIHQLFLDFKKLYDPVTWQVFYIILIALVSHETGNANKNVNGTYSRVWVGKNLSGVFPIRN